MKKLMEMLEEKFNIEAFYRDNRELIIKVAAVALAIVAAFLFLLPVMMIQELLPEMMLKRRFLLLNHRLLQYMWISEEK